MIRFSFLNLAEGASIAASTTFTEAESGVGVRFPTRPHLRGYTADLASHRVTLDFATATSLDVIASIHGNFSVASFQGNATDAWGAPSYAPAAVTITRAGNTRYHYAHRPSVAVPFSVRHLSLSVPTGDTTDGTTRWALGGIWAGRITSPPRDILMGPEESRLDAYQDLETPDGRTLQRVVFDHPAWTVRCTRLAETEAELAAWMAIDALWAAAPGQAALVLMRDAYPAECYVMRQVSVSRWIHERIWMRSEMELKEVTAG